MSNMFLKMVMSNSCLIQINNYIPYISLSLVSKDIVSRFFLLRLLKTKNVLNNASFFLFASGEMPKERYQ